MKNSNATFLVIFNHCDNMKVGKSPEERDMEGSQRYHGYQNQQLHLDLAQCMKSSKNISSEMTCIIRLFLVIFNHCVPFVSIADPRFVIQYLSIGKHWAPRCLFVIQWHLCYGSFEKYLPKPKFHKSYFEQHLQLCRPGKKRYFQGLLLLSSLYT